ncbi:MAG: KdsC family phosphatase [Parvularculaceae bacterium]
MADPQFAEKARRIRLFGIDFDGVMTDNGVYVFEDGREAVRCSRLDGYGLARLKRAGAHPVIVSTEKNRVVAARAKKLGVDCVQNVDDKVKAMARLLGSRRLDWDAAAFIGNDVNDLEILKRVGLPLAVSDAHDCLVALDLFRTRRPGGAGAVREACDAIAAALEEASRAPVRRTA